MPATSGATAEVLLGANVKKFLSGMAKAVRGSKRAIAKLKQHQASMKKASMVAGVALAAQILFIKKVTNAAGVQELAEKKLADALSKRAGATQETTDALIAQAAALQTVTKFGDEAIIEAQALLATYGVMTDQMEEATKATLDFASATGRDLKTAALTVGKSVGAGFTAELSRYGIILDVSTIPKTEVAAAVLAKLNEQFGGRAQQEAQTYSGRLQQMKNILGDVGEEIGFTLIPAITSMLMKIKPILLGLSKWIEANQKLVATMIGIGVGGTGLIFGLSMLGLLLSGLPALLVALTSPLGLVVIGLIGIATAIALITANKEALPDTARGIREMKKAAIESLLEINAKMDVVRKAQAKREREGLDSWKEHEMELADLGRQANKAAAEITALNEALIGIEGPGKRTPAFTAELYAGIDTEPLVPSPEAMATRDETTALDEQKDMLDELNKNWEIQRAIRKNVHNEAMDYGDDETDMWEDMAAQQGQMTADFATNWASALEFVLEHEKQFASAFGKAMLLSLFGIFRSIIQAYIAEISATMLLEKGKALIKAPLTLGATLVAIAPIAAAGAAAIAGLNALESKFIEKNIVGSFAEGGFVPETGLALVHKGELVLNAEQQVAGGVTWNQYGDITSDVDMDRAVEKLGELMRFSTFKG